MSKGRPFQGRLHDARWRYRTAVLKGLAQKPRTGGDMRDDFAVYCGGHKGIVTDVLAWLCDNGLAKVPEKRGVGVYRLTETGTAAVLALKAGATLKAWLEQHEAQAKDAAPDDSLTPHQERVITSLLAEARREGAAA